MSLFDKIRRIYNQNFNNATELLHRDVLLEMAGGVTQIDRVQVVSGTITSALFVDLDNTTLKSWCTAHADGTELLTRNRTNIQNSSSGIVSLDTTAYDGATVYVKRYINS